MTTVDYNQTAEDHQGFLVLIKQTGKQLSWKHFHRCWERIVQLDCVAIPGQNRDMWIRYKKSYSKESNEWGDFQAHRKVLGLVAIGKCSTEAEFDDLFEHYKKEKDQFSETLFNSRLIAFGMNSDGSELTEDQVRKLNASPEHLSMKLDKVQNEKNCDKVISDKNNKNSEEKFGTGNEHTDPLRKSSPAKKNVSDSKSTVTAKGDAGNVKQPVTKTFSNSSRNKELTGSEVVFYPSLNHSDNLEESVKEFVTSLFFVLEGKRLDRSFEKVDRQQLLCAPFEKKDYVGVDLESKSFKKKCQGRLRKHLADLCLQASLPGEAMLHYTTSIDILKPVNDYLWMAACYEGLCAASVISSNTNHLHSTLSTTSLRRNQSFSVKRGVAGMEKQRGGSINHSGSYANGLQDLPNMAAKSSVDADDIIDKYKEALMYYTKYKNAGVVEMEASFKACRVLIEQKKFLQAADFLQNVVYINLQLSDEDRISRYSTLSSLYEQIGFRRKSSFFRRVAAMQCVAPQNPKQDWHQCHELLVKTLSGYQIHVSDSTVKAGMTDGWPVVQIRVLHEMIYSARRMSNLPLAIRYTTLLLHGLLDHLSSQEKRDLASSLETFTSQCEGTPQLLELESGLKIPPVHLYRIPLVRMFKLMPLHPHLEPRNWKQTSDTSDNVFIFTPLNIGTVDNEQVKTDVDFCWVQGDISEVQLRVVNPMPDEVKVGHLTLLTEGVEVEPFPTSPALPSGSGPYLVKLMLRPTTSGDLSIMGYSTKLFGVKSNCKLRDCPLIQESHFKVKVVPALPTIQLSSSLPKSASFLSFGEEFNVVTSGTVVLYTGQSCECVVTLQNSGKHPVEKVRASLEASRDSKDCVDEVFRWSEDNINSQLPLQTNSMLCFTLALNGVSDFLLPRDVLKSSTASASKNISVEGKSVEAILKLEYSGGPGLSEGYCRCCSIAFTVEVNPSLVFHSWDVMPSESCDHCYLLFDVQNVSGLELQVQYSNQSVYLQPGQIRRLCLQIERCQPQVQCEDKSLEQTFSQYLATFVDIRWTIPSQSVSGRVSIDQLTWTEEQQSLVHTSPVSWEVKLNGQLLSPLHIGSLEYRVGEMIHLDIELNFKPDCEDVEGQAGALSICCCQYCDNGNILYNTGNQVFPLGTQSLAVPKVSTDDSIHHSCTYMFLCSGLYRFEVTMKVKGECQGSRSPQPRAEEMPEVKVQTWKCSSVIEVNIED